MRLDKIIYDAREAINAYTEDLEIDNRYIIYLYGIKRAKYLRQDLNNLNKTIDLSIQQQLCLDMIEVSSNECSLDFECDTLLRSKDPLPKLIELHTKSAIINVKPSNRMAIPFNFMTKERLYYLEGASYPNSMYAFLDTDGHIYVYSNNDSYKMLECISVTGVFEDPLDLANYRNCCGCDDVQPCFDELTSEYPLQPHFIDLIKNEIVQELILKLRIPEGNVPSESSRRNNER